MKYGFINSNKKAILILSEIKMLTDKDILVENIIIAKSFDDIKQKAFHGDSFIVVDYKDVFLSFNHFLFCAIYMLDNNIDMSSLCEADMPICHQSEGVIRGVCELKKNMRSRKIKIQTPRSIAQRSQVGRPRVTAKINKVTDLRSSLGISVAKACKVADCNERTYYRYLAAEKKSSFKS